MLPMVLVKALKHNDPSTFTGIATILCKASGN